ncbi:MAG: hypothetical protein H6709_19840 [Kofleriaceae bacterium]|nr:hypothetical protein [Kofleriaceae bacterium]
MPGADICVDACNTNADCRTAEGYRCFDPGSGAAKYCRHPQVGDAARQRPTAAVAPGSARLASFPGGYCTLSACPTPGSLQDCSPNSVCFDDGAAENYCVDRCPGIGTQSTCRTGYTCVDTDPGAATIGGCVPL